MADASLQFGLARDAGFLGRLSALMSQIAKEKIGIDAGDAYAKKVLGDPFSAAQRAVFYILQGDNFVARTISISVMGSGFAMTIANTDAEASGQIRDTWTTLAALFG